MRKTKFTFFIILVALTAVLLFIIIGEDRQYDNLTNMSALTMSDDVLELNKVDLITNYQNAFSNILYEYQQLILWQSISRQDAVMEIREKILAIIQIPVELQSLHLRAVIAFSRDLNGYTDEAVAVYKKLQIEYNWLFSKFNFLLD